MQERLSADLAPGAVVFLPYSLGNSPAPSDFPTIAGQGKRLDYLHSLLGVTHCGDRIRYQLLHRTASALLTAREFHAQVAVMLVHSFGDKPSLRADFDAFCNALATRPLSSEVHVAPTFSSPHLYMAWCSGNRKYLDVEFPSVF